MWQKKIKLLCINLSKMSGYAKCFDEVKHMNNR